MSDPPIVLMKLNASAELRSTSSRVVVASEASFYERLRQKKTATPHSKLIAEVKQTIGLMTSFLFILVVFFRLVHWTRGAVACQ